MPSQRAKLNLRQAVALGESVEWMKGIMSVHLNVLGWLEQPLRLPLCAVLRVGDPFQGRQLLEANGTVLVCRQ